ncbi:hypothetical protein EFB08_04690 [Rufibacter latericius]|uniref:Uncharacterized protein n=1 Tax=Rufibacter latericius TaxID=2487040 RepID=A0A3M9MZI7_9BACT|nr:hypothetical protein EFB08_04690 [Rufibacter latericius]
MANTLRNFFQTVYVNCDSFEILSCKYFGADPGTISVQFLLLIKILFFGVILKQGRTIIFPAKN